MTASTADPDTAVPGGLVMTLLDDVTEIHMTGGGAWTLPIGVDTLLDGPLADSPAGRPRPEQLTNALGIVHDHLEDVIIEAPIVASAPSLTTVGDHAIMLARVEVGTDHVDPPVTLARSDVDEVFRTIVGETREERTHNPGLDPHAVDSVIATCCTLLAVVRRLDFHEFVVAGWGG